MGNRPEEFDRFLASDGKAKRKEAFDENKAKLQYLPDYEKNVLGSSAKICEHNGRIMKARLQKGIWKVQLQEGVTSTGSLASTVLPMSSHTPTATC